MIDYNNDESSMVMDCDGYDCDESLEMYGDFVECIQEAKDNGWKVMKIDEEWEHFCPRCYANRDAQGVFE
jgi:hypothetical protein